MPLRNKLSDEIVESIIEVIVELDYKKIKSSTEFEFDWQLERKNEVYKIYLLDSKKEILGLMSIIDTPEEYRIHLNLIEVSRSNRGKSKKIDNIAGALIAFACEIAFKRGYFGFVSLQPKTELINLYQDKYGFCQYGRLLGVEQEASKFLINKYLNNENW